MHWRFSITMVLLATVLLRGELATSQEVLTNESVIQMVQAGLSEGVILTRIRSGPAKFDVRTEALIALKQAGIPDSIIEAMVTQGAGTASPPPAPASPPPVALPIPQWPGMPSQREVIVYHVIGDKQIALVAAGGEIQRTREFMGYKEELVLPKRKATYRVNDRQPEFMVSVSSADAPLVRLKPGGSRDDRNLKIGSTSSGMWGGGTDRRGVRTEDQLDVEVQATPNGLFRIKPRKPLPPGEYAFVVTLGFPGRSGGRVFDFGVD